MKTYRDGEVIAIGAPAPDNLMTAPRLIAINRLADVAKFTTPEILQFAHQGMVYVCNSLVAAWRVLHDLRDAGATTGHQLERRPCSKGHKCQEDGGKASCRAKPGTHGHHAGGL